MAISTYDNYVTRRDAPYQTIDIVKAGIAATTTGFTSGWTAAGFPAAGAAPTTAAVPDRTTAGAFGQFNSSGTQRILKVAGTTNGIAAGTATTAGRTIGTIIIADRLSHQGGLSGTVTTQQTTNLPTATLTRYTSGVGVMAAVEVYTALGATATTFTCGYDGDGGTGHTSIAATIGSSQSDRAGLMIPMPLASGDKGVKKVNSVTVLASTLTAGNFGFTLFYPLIIMPLISSRIDDGTSYWEALMDFAWFPQVVDNACLFMIGGCGGGVWFQTGMRVHFGED